MWHKDESLQGADVVVLPGGFSYGDYLRSGAIARFSPVMTHVSAFAQAGGPVVGICNGFQVLLESGLLPGGMRRNRHLKFICEHVHIRVEQTDTPFTLQAQVGQVLRIPIAHGDGNYYADADTIAALEANRQIIFRYTTAAGELSEAANVNGSTAAIAGICSRGAERRGVDAPSGAGVRSGPGQHRWAGDPRVGGGLARRGRGGTVMIDQATIDAHGLTADEYQRVLDILGREPNLTELGIFSVMWSEHCSYKSSRLHLRKLPTSGPRVLQGPGEKRWRDRHWRRARRGVQDRVAQSPVLHRALSGRGDRRRRHHP